jgi:hypothetical protein
MIANNANPKIERNITGCNHYLVCNISKWKFKLVLNFWICLFNNIHNISWDRHVNKFIINLMNKKYLILKKKQL